VETEGTKSGDRGYQEWRLRVPGVETEGTKSGDRGYQEWRPRVPRVETEGTKSGDRGYQEWRPRVPRETIWRFDLIETKKNIATSQNTKAIITTDVETVTFKGIIWIKWCRNSTKLAENNVKCNKWISV
jgi:hypothetical protein